MVVLICISLLTNDMVSVQISCSFSNWIVCFLAAEFRAFLYVLDINPLLGM